MEFEQFLDSLETPGGLYRFGVLWFVAVAVLCLIAFGFLDWRMEGVCPVFVCGSPKWGLPSI